MAKQNKAPWVVSRHGRYRYRRGIIIAHILRLGLDMDVALAVSDLLRNRLAGRGEVSGDELEAELFKVLQADYDYLPVEPNHSSGKRILSDLGLLPFSRGVLIRRVVATGLSLEDALPLVEEVAQAIAAHPDDEIPELFVATTAEEQLRALHGPGFARRYRVTTAVRNMKAPVIILIGGAVGTGKSSIATELAYRLGIRKITSTDMIRETMRTVLSAEVVPGLHDHSFRGIIQGGKVLSDPRERVLAGFRQQAAQVAVGVRAVIRRALRERTPLIIEGTHLLPPFARLFPPAADAHVVGMVLSVLRRRDHLKRFPARQRAQPDRGAATYLDAFQSVRWIHDDILRLAEDHDAHVIENADLSQSIAAAVEHLSQVLPLDITKPPAGQLEMPAPEPIRVPTMLIVLDGLADEPNPALDGLTPLAAANTPTLDCLAGSGAQGLLKTTPEGVSAHTDVGLMTLLWEHDERPKLGRGLMEALGNGLPLQANTVVLRGNLATMADGVIIDRRAGRIRTGNADLLNGLRDIGLPGGVIGNIYPGHEHRVVVTLNGPNLSAAIGDSDPGSSTVIRPPVRVVALDDSPEAARTAEALNRLLHLAHQHLDTHPYNAERAARGQHPANTIITRGAAHAGAISELPRAVRTSAIVAACPTVLGVGRMAGLTPISTSTMTGNLDTDIDVKFVQAREQLKSHEFVVVHFKATDIAAHDRKPVEKRDFITEVDAALGRLLTEGLDPPVRIVVTADHGTSSLTGDHLQDPVPILISRWDPEAELAEFSEVSAAQGELGLIRADEFRSLLWTHGKDVLQA